MWPKTTTGRPEPSSVRPSLPNLARSVWEVKPSEDEESSVKHVTLYYTKVNIEQAATIDCGSIAMSMTVYDTCFLGLLMIELNGLPGAQDCRVPVCLSEGSLSQTYLILN